jgi:hypothetical protein
MIALALYLLHHPVRLGALAFVGALWKGASREVARFGEDAAHILFARLRRLLRMKP